MSKVTPRFVNPLDFVKEVIDNLSFRLKETSLLGKGFLPVLFTLTTKKETHAFRHKSGPHLDWDSYVRANCNLQTVDGFALQLQHTKEDYIAYKEAIGKAKRPAEASEITTQWVYETIEKTNVRTSAQATLNNSFSLGPLKNQRLLELLCAYAKWQHGPWES